MTPVPGERERARRPHPASLPVRVPTVAPLPRASFDSRSHDPLLALRLRLPPPVPMISFHIISSDPCRAHKGPTSGRRHPAQILPGSEEVFEPIVVAHDPVNNPPTAPHDLRRQHHNEVQEAAELHPE